MSSIVSSCLSFARRSALLATVLSAAITMLPARPLVAGTIWTYDFGTSTGSFTTGESTTFLPAPPAGGGTARLRVGSGGGQFDLINPGSGSSSLVATAPSTTSVNKFSIIDFRGTGLFTVEAELTFIGGASGSWYLLVGNGAAFGNNTSFATAEVFAGLRWDFGSAGSLATTRLSTSGSWLTTNVPSFTQDRSYRLKIYGNNTAAAVMHAGQPLAANTWELWVDGVRANSGIAKAGLADGSVVDSLMFNGLSSTGNVATLRIGSLTYANALVPEPGGWPLAAAGLASLLVMRMRRKQVPWSVVR